LTSLSWADALVVLDSASTDATLELASAEGALIHQRAFDNFSRQRQAALDLVDTEWTLFVDADERVTESLATEVRGVVRSGEGRAGYWIPRRNFFWGREIRGGGWWPDRQLRLVRTERARFDLERPVHEVADISGPAGDLTAPLVHLNYDSWGEFRTKQARYARLEARRRASGGRPARRAGYVTVPAREFWRRFVQLDGWRDGPTGLGLALHMAWFEGVTHAQTRRLQRAGH
jgi:hypothetical protein